MDCRHDFESGDPSPACPACGSLEVAAEGGDEVVLERLEYVDTSASADRPDQLVPAHTHDHPDDRADERADHAHERAPEQAQSGGI